MDRLHYFPKAKRLDNAGVVLLLKGGRRICNRAFELWVAPTPIDAPVDSSRVAFAVSKRQLASAVARNRIRRMAREVFRVHPVADFRFDLLVKYRLRADARHSVERGQIRGELSHLFSKVASIVSKA